MENFFSHLHEAFSYGYSSIILLGILIFVHELGHFLVAKYYKVRVETFSLGFGKKILQYKRGDTTYCLSLIPLGGYVKMYGDDPAAEVPAEEKKWSFLHKPVGQRMAIVLAGPLMNFFFAILVFALVAVVGERVLGPQLGDIDASSVAGKVGFQSGDVVEKIDQELIRNWENIYTAIAENPNKTLNFKVKRGDSTVDLQATPILVENDNMLTPRSEVGKIEGLTNMALASMVGVSNPASAAGAAGLQTGDILTDIQGTAVNYWRELAPVFVRELAKSDKLTIKIRRKDGTDYKDLTLNLQAPLKAVNADNVLTSLGIERTDLFLSSVMPESPAQVAGLEANDRVVSINNQRLSDWDELVKLISAYQAGQAPLAFNILRQGVSKEIQVTPKLSKMPKGDGGEEQRFTVGIQPLTTFAQPQTFIEKTSNPLTAAMIGFKKTWYWSEVTVLTFVRIFQNKISSRNLGGIISIATIAKTTFDMGISEFLRIMGLISINLFILNLLPIPVLDGGHLVFFTIEALKGAPLSLRKMEIAQQVGLVLILALMVFSLFNDFSRVFSN